MSKALLGSVLVLVASAGGLLAQGPPAPLATNPTPGGSGWHDGTPINGWSGHSEDLPAARVWGSTDYLLWWVKDGPLPFPLVTTGPGASDNPGALGHGGVPILTGPNVAYDTFSGARVTLGTGIAAENCLGIEGSGFLLPKRTQAFRAHSDANGSPVLTFRYLDPPDARGVAAEDAFQASVPFGNPFGVGPFAGGLAVSTTSRLWGAEANAVVRVCDAGDLRLDVLSGFRYADLDENLNLQFQRGAIGDSVVFFRGNPFPAPASVSSADNFHVRNQFYGGQVGLRGEYQFGKLFVGGTGKLALGSTHESQNVFGTSTLLPAVGPAVTVPGGQFAGLSNLGRSEHNEFAVIPEVSLKAGYQVTGWLRGFVGYDVFYWSRVIRPGNQVDLVVDTRADQVDPAFVPGSKAVFPQPQLRHSDFWAQGINFGLEFNF